MFPDGLVRRSERSDRSVRPVFADLPTVDARHQNPAPTVPAAPPAPDGGGPALPMRTPRRLASTTAPAASLDAWRPATASAHGTTVGGPPPPPDGAVDPRTGEPDPQAYRRWLRDWLEYVESQP
jgi:hypothetical protein